MSVVRIMIFSFFWMPMPLLAIATIVRFLDRDFTVGRVPLCCDNFWMIMLFVFLQPVHYTLGFPTRGPRQMDKDIILSITSPFRATHWPIARGRRLLNNLTSILLMMII